MSTGYQFFELKSPRDMLEKARREFTRLQADQNTDNVFNFVVTVNHIRDYAIKYGVPPDQLPQGRDFELCWELCNMAKHLGHRYTYKDNQFRVESVKLWADGLWADGLWDGKQPIFEFEGNQLNILEIAETVIKVGMPFLRNTDCDSFPRRIILYKMFIWYRGPLLPKLEKSEPHAHGDT